MDVPPLVDALDHTPRAQTVSFGFDGGDYEIDLSADHARELRALLGGYARRGRRVAAAGRRLRQPGPTQVQLPPDTATLRAWAASRGIELPRRGRIPAAVLDAFAAAH